MAKTIDHVYFQGHTFGEVMYAVPYMSGFILLCGIFVSLLKKSGITGDLRFIQICIFKDCAIMINEMMTETKPLTCIYMNETNHGYIFQDFSRRL